MELSRQQMALHGVKISENFLKMTDNIYTSTYKTFFRMDQTDMKVAIAELSALNKMIKRREFEVSKREEKLAERENLILNNIKNQEEIRRLTDSVTILRREKKSLKKSYDDLEKENQRLTARVDRLEREIANDRAVKETLRKNQKEVVPYIEPRKPFRKPVIKSDGQTEISLVLFDVVAEIFHKNFQISSDRQIDNAIALSSRLHRLWREQSPKTPPTLQSLRLGLSLTKFLSSNSNSSLSSSLLNALNALSLLSYNNQCSESLRLRTRIIFSQAEFDLWLVHLKWS